VLRILSDILTSMDNEQVTLLALLDLSAAFYCVDHDILLSKLQSSYVLGGITLEHSDCPATPTLMIPSYTSASRHQNRRQLQPSWRHVSKV